MNHKQSLINSLVSIAGDYQKVDFNSSHVQRWVEQFPDDSHEVLLRNLVSILEKTYYSKNEVEVFFQNVLQDDSIFLEPLEKYTFLDIQDRGNSQKDMLKIINEQCYSIFGKRIKKSNFNEHHNYVYVDDAIYSGNRLKWDIVDWAATLPDVNAEINLLIIVIGIHCRNLDYVLDEIKKRLPKVNIECFSDIIFIDYNKLFLGQYESYLAPEMEYSQISMDYIEQIDSQRSANQKQWYPLLRNKETMLEDSYFVSLQERNIVEAMFLEQGVQIEKTATFPNIRPLGYDKNRTLGFGSFLVTYRNIANNCPLVLWWGDENGHASISNWYPLFPRTVN